MLQETLFHQQHLKLLLFHQGLHFLKYLVLRLILMFLLSPELHRLLKILKLHLILKFQLLLQYLQILRLHLTLKHHQNFYLLDYYLHHLFLQIFLLN